jgi:hypothetical protein
MSAVIAAALAVVGVLALGGGSFHNAFKIQRNTGDRPDDISGAQIHVMYVLPADGEDEQLDTSGTIAMSIAAAQNWFTARTDGRWLKFDTAGGQLDVTFLRLSRGAADLAKHGLFIREELQGDLRKAGFDARDKIYLVYYGGSGVACGGSSWPPAVQGNVTALYLRGTPPNARPCHSNSLSRSLDKVGYWETSALHELLHSFGAVATCAPNHTRAGHVSDDPDDLMYAGDLPWRPSIIDAGRNDYFGHGRRDCFDLANSPYLGGPGEKPVGPK